MKMMSRTAFGVNVLRRLGQNMRRVLPAVLLNVLAMGAQAATITWGSATTISGDADVATGGVKLYAYCWGTAATVNGVAFTATKATGNVGTDLSLSSAFTATNSTTFGASGTPYDSLTANYKNIIKGAVYGSASAGTVTLRNLVVGRSYTVQIWVHDGRAGTEGAATRYEDVTSGPRLYYYAGGTGSSPAGGVGQYAVGTFTADATTQGVTLTPGGGTTASVQLNAIQVRDNASTDGVWNTNTSALNWGTAGNWLNNVIAGDVAATADFGKVNISTDPTVVNLEANRTIGNLIFGDTDTSAASAAGWSLSGNTLTLSASSPKITVNALGTGKSVQISSILAGSNGLSKDGTGMLVLSGNNSFSGNITLSYGTLQATHSGALGSGTKTVVSTAGNGILQLDGTAGNLDFASIGVDLSGSRIRNVAGDNRIGGRLGAAIGAGTGYIECNGGTLTIAGNVRSVNSGGRVLNFSGTSTGTNTISGLIENGVSMFSLEKDGVGLWIIAGSGNTYTGTTKIVSGTLAVASIANGGVACSLGSGLAAPERLIFDGGTLSYIGATAMSDRAFTINGGKTATIDVTNSTATLTLAGATGTATSGALVKIGAGTLTLSGANTYSGGTVVSNGTLVLSAANAGGTGDLTVANGATCTVTSVSSALADTATVSLGVSAVMSLGAGVIETVRFLNIDGVQQVSGTWDATRDPVHFSGTGSLLVLEGAARPDADGIWSKLSAGIWGDTNNWLNSSVASGKDRKATFGQATGVTVTQDIPALTNGALVFATGGYVIQGGALTLDATSGKPSVTVSNSVSTQISTALAGTAGLAKQGPGTLVLAGSNNYAGGTDVREGTLQVAVGGTLGTAGTVTLGTGASGTLGTVGHLTNQTDLTVGALSVQQNTATLLGADVAQLAVAADKTLTVASLDVGLLGSGVRTALATGSAGQGGRLTVSGDVRIGKQNTGNSYQAVNLSGLSVFTAGNGAGNFWVGYGGYNEATLILAGTSNQINVTTISVGETDASQNSGLNNILNLGAGENVLHATTIRMGTQKASGVLRFAGATGSVKMTGAGGSGSVTSLIVGDHSGASYQQGGLGNQLLLAGHPATINATSLIINRKASTSGGNMNSVVTFDTGTFTVGGISMGVSTAMGTTNTATGNITVGTDAASTGVMDVTTDVVLADNDSTSTLGVSGELVIKGGTMTVGGNILDKSTTATGTSTTKLTLEGGTLNLTDGRIGGTGASGDRMIGTLNFRSGTLKNVQEINNGAALIKTTAGLLTLSGTNTYSGGTIVSNGTLKVASDKALPTPGTVSLSSGATLDIAGASPAGARITAAAFAGFGGTVRLSTTDRLVVQGNLSGTCTFSLSDPQNLNQAQSYILATFGGTPPTSLTLDNVPKPWVLKVVAGEVRLVWAGATYISFF